MSSERMEAVAALDRIEKQMEAQPRVPMAMVDELVEQAFNGSVFRASATRNTCRSYETRDREGATLPGDMNTFERLTRHLHVSTDEADRMARALEGMTPEQREAHLLCATMSQREAAKVLGISHQSVCRRIKRGKKKICAIDRVPR